jgi:hypothetical protein
MSLAIAANRFTLPRLLYPSFHGWLLALAVLDVVLTWTVLGLGGEEFNAAARMIIQWGGLPAMAAFKVLSILTVLAIAEYIGRSRHALGRRLISCAVALNTAPVAMAAVILSLYVGAVLDIF